MHKSLLILGLILGAVFPAPVMATASSTNYTLEQEMFTGGSETDTSSINYTSNSLIGSREGMEFIVSPPPSPSVNPGASANPGSSSNPSSATASSADTPMIMQLGSKAKKSLVKANELADGKVFEPLDDKIRQLPPIALANPKTFLPWVWLIIMGLALFWLLFFWLKRRRQEPAAESSLVV
jgi:hypothetical protein